MSKSKILLLILVLLLLGGGLYFATGWERRQVTVWKTDIRGEWSHREKELLGVQALLKAQGRQDKDIELVQLSDNVNLIAPGTNQLLIVSDSNLKTRTDAEYLLDWVARGNHVVIETPTDYSIAEDDDEDEEDEQEERYGYSKALFETLKLKHGEKEFPEAEKEQEAVAIHPACADSEKKRLAAAEVMSDDEKRLERDFNQDKYARLNVKQCSFYINSIKLPEGKTLYFDNNHHGRLLQPQAGSQVMFKGENHLSGSQIVRVRHGEGSLTFSSTTSWLKNPEYPPRADSGLKLYDHAYLVSYLAQGKSKIVLLGELRSRTPPLRKPVLWVILTKYAALSWPLLALLALAVWRIAARIGPVRSLPPAPERYLGQHLLAQGRFFARHFSERSILADLQQELLEHLERRYPSWHQLTPAKRLDFVCSQTKLSADTVKPWLEPLPAHVGPVEWLAMLSKHRLLMRRLPHKWY